MSDPHLREALRAAVQVDLALPGGGATRDRFGALFDVARKDLVLARLAEAHHDAVAIAAELNGSLVPGSLYGVWAASGPDALTIRRTGDGLAVTGRASWCTGFGIVDRALVTVKGLLIDLPVAECCVQEGPSWKSPAFASANTASLRVSASLNTCAVVGDIGQYLSRPGFWHGAIGVAACWAGGAAGLYELQLEKWRRQDPHSLAHLGSAYSWLAAMKDVLAAAADSIDSDPAAGDRGEIRARAVRHVVERGCTSMIDDLGRGAGPEPLGYDEAILSRTQQLQLYIRQCHGERDLAPLGEALFAMRPHVPAHRGET